VWAWAAVVQFDPVLSTRAFFDGGELVLSLDIYDVCWNKKEITKQKWHKFDIIAALIQIKALPESLSIHRESLARWFTNNLEGKFGVDCPMK